MKSKSIYWVGYVKYAKIKVVSLESMVLLSYHITFVIALMAISVNGYGSVPIEVT